MQPSGLQGLSRALDPEQTLLVSATASMPPPEPSEPQHHVNVTNLKKEVVQAPVAAQAPGNAESETSLINSFTIKDIETHLASLDQTTLLTHDQARAKGHASP